MTRKRLVVLFRSVVVPSVSFVLLLLVPQWLHGQSATTQKLLSGPRWQRAVYGAQVSRWTGSGDAVLCGIKDGLIALDRDDGEIKWRRDGQCSYVVGRSGEIFTQTRGNSVVYVLSAKTGEVSREFRCPDSILLYDRLAGGICFGRTIGGRQIVQFQEGSMTFEVLANGPEMAKHWGMKRLYDMVILYADQHAVYFTINGKMGKLDVATRSVTLPAANLSLRPAALLQMSENSLFLVMTSSGIVSVDDEGRIHRQSVVKTNTPCIFLRKHHVAIYSEESAKHVPAFVRVASSGSIAEQRIPYFNSVITSLTLNRAESQFVVTDRIGNIAVWDVPD